MSNAPTVWMRAIRWHTYQGRPQEIGDVYLAHADMVETIETVLKFAVRDVPPPRLTRAAAAPVAALIVELPPTPTPEPTPAVRRRRAVRATPRRPARAR